MEKVDKEISIKCNCGHGEIKIMKWFWDEHIQYFVSYWEPVYYNKHPHIWEDFKERMKYIWMIIRGKDYQLFEVTLQEDQYLDFVEKVTKLKDLNVEDAKE